MTSGSTILIEESVPQYLAENAEKIGVFSSDAKLTAKAILGGNVNYAFCATEESTGKKIFVKQAPEFVAIFGPDGLPLSSARMKQEIAVFDEWRTILGPELCSKYLPNIYLFDSKSSLLKENLSTNFIYRILTRCLIPTNSKNDGVCDGFSGNTYLVGS